MTTNTSRIITDTSAREAGGEDAASRKFGMVLFDDVKTPTAGWVSVNGSPARRVDGINHLATDTLWWTNIPSEDFFRSGSINPWLRSEAFMVVKPRDVLAEWGMDPETQKNSPTFAVQMLSTMFTRIMTMAFRLAKECNERVRIRNFFGARSLTEDLLTLLPKPDFPTGEAAAIMQAGQAFSHFSKTAMRGVKGARQFRLRRPRIPYAIEMLTTPVPVGPFQFRSRSDLRSIAPDRVGWVRSTDNPCMVEITVQMMDGDIAPVYGFGNSTDNKRIARSWVTHNEFLAMSSFSEIDVESAWVGREYSQLNLKMPEPVRRFLSDPHIETSWSAGVIAETLWRAACLGEEKKRGAAPGEPRAQTSWRGAWIRGADKVAGFLSAMQLADMGYAVASYGYGWVFCQVLDDQIPDLIRDGLSIGLMPSLYEVPDGMFNKKGSVPWGGDPKSGILSRLTITREKHLLWNLDKVPLYEGEQRAGMVKQILEAHRAKQL